MENCSPLNIVSPLFELQNFAVYPISADSSLIDPIINLALYETGLSIAAFTNWLQIGLYFCPLVLIITNRVGDTILWEWDTNPRIV